jgi:hypothetical protein
MQATWLCGREKSWYACRVSLPVMLDQSEPAKKIRFFSWRQRTPRITTENAEKQKKRNLAKLAQFDNAIVIEIMSVVLTIYLVKSFEYRTMKTMVLKEVDLSMKASELMAQISSNILHCLPPHSFSFLHPPISFWAIALTLALTYPKSICVPAIPKRHPGYSAHHDEGSSRQAQQHLLHQ